MEFSSRKNRQRIRQFCLVFVMILMFMGVGYAYYVAPTSNKVIDAANIQILEAKQFKTSDLVNRPDLIKIFGMVDEKLPHSDQADKGGDLGADKPADVILDGSKEIPAGNQTDEQTSNKEETVQPIQPEPIGDKEATKPSDTVGTTTVDTIGTTGQPKEGSGSGATEGREPKEDSSGYLVEVNGQNTLQFALKVCAPGTAAYFEVEVLNPGNLAVYVSDQCQNKALKGTYDEMFNQMITDTYIDVELMSKKMIIEPGKKAKLIVKVSISNDLPRTLDWQGQTKSLEGIKLGFNSSFPITQGRP
jgi:hypothetical protein